MRALIVDDHRIVASGCRALFADDPEIEIVEASDAESGERSFVEQHPDICVLDINLPTGVRVRTGAAHPRARCVCAYCHVQHER